MAMKVRNKSLRSKEVVEIKTQGWPSSGAPPFLHSFSWGGWGADTFPGVLICICTHDNKGIKKTSFYCKIRKRNDVAD